MPARYEGYFACWAAFICALGLLSLTWAPAAEAIATAQGDNTANGSRRSLAGLAACSVVLLIAYARQDMGDEVVSGLAIWGIVVASITFVPVAVVMQVTNSAIGGPTMAQHYNMSPQLGSGLNLMSNLVLTQGGWLEDFRI